MVLEFVDQVAGRRAGQRFNPESLLKFTSLHPQVQYHLQRVYLTLSISLALCALGCCAGMYLSGLVYVAQIAAFVCMLGLAFTRDSPQTLNKRYGFLAGFSFSQGCALTPLVAMASALYPGVVLSAVLATAAVFLCFSGAALLTQRRAYLFLGGYLASALAALSVLRFTSWLVGSAGFGLNLDIYAGILVFAGYILFDTQLIIEKAYAGEMDHVQHAQDLLLDLLALFVRVLLALLRNAEKKEQERQRKDRQRRS